MRRTFKLKRHDDYGTIGLAPTFTADGMQDPLVGMTTAHDILEHGRNDKTEWQGLGGSVYVRGEGYFNRKGSRYSAAENLASDFIQCCHDYQGDVADPGPTRALDDDEAEEIIQEAVNKGCALVRSELRDNDDELARKFATDENKRRMIGWMRKGYRAARRRWQGAGQGMLEETFCAIEEAVDRFLKHEDCEAYEGATVIVQFDPRRATVNVEMERDPYDY
jgi:hypothetical protein